MSSEFLEVWRDENASEYHLNAANLSAISPHILYTNKEILTPVSGANSKLTILGDSAFKVIIGGIHRLYRINNDIEFSPVDCLDTGSSLNPGTDYHVYLVTSNDNTASLVVSLNATFPDGANAENSRRIGGFHTLCSDIGALQQATHSLYGYMARDILPMSIWDLLKRPINTCEPQGMVRDPNTNTWVDIYLQSGTGKTTTSKYQGTVTNTRSWDSHMEDFLAVGKRMLTDKEFTSAAWGTIPYRAVLGAVDPVTTGGKTNTDGMRIVSNIGCEDMAGCYWQWLDEDSDVATAASWADTNPNDQGKVYQTPGKLIAGGFWAHAASAGARCRLGYPVRSNLRGDSSSRGCANGQNIV